MPAASTDRPAEADTVEGIAAALRDDPVLVHEALGNGRTEEVHAGLSDLVGDLADAGVPAYVALVQTPNVQLAGQDSSDDLLRLVHAELDEPGVYVVSTPAGQTAVGTYGVPLEAVYLSLGRYDALEHAVAPLAEGDFVSAAGQAAVLLSVAADDDQSLSADQVGDLVAGGPWLAEYGEEPMGYELAEAHGEPLTTAVVAIACALTAATVGWRLLRARAALATERPEPRGKRPERAARPERGARADATVASVASVAREARSAVKALRREIDRNLTLVPDEAYGCLEAAEDLVGSSSRLEVLGALVLAEQGSARLRGDALPVRCYFDPRHGPRARTATVSGVSLPACAACAAAVAAGREPESLSVDRGTRPYWRDDSIWAETGLGSLDPELWRLVTEGAR
ncbi:hypothetical protein [Nocardioides sp. W7]|uniref:hypothetical protein n=1 Tax=Nocardioides sp. W7 TaxID=2931390 RepID=UPI001FD1AA92|nr:hypothetical protein [Nocardioides sp. W7]